MSQWVFEDAEQAALFRAWFPQNAESAWNFQAWMETLLPPPQTPGERLAIFSGFAGVEAEQAALSLRTIEELRRSLILQREHVAHCFLELPSSQKNRRLRELFLQYLDSPLAEDFTASVWNLIHALKTGTFRLKSEEWIFVPAAAPGFLFKEFATAALMNHPESKLRAFSELGNPLDPEGPADPLALVGTRGLCLESFAERLLELGDGPHWIPLAASAGSEAWLRYRLLHAGRRAARWEANTVAGDFFSDILSAIKRQSELAMVDRLRLISTLRKRPPRQGETRQTYLERLATGVISPEQTAWLKSRPADEKPAPSATEAAAIQFIPWQAVPLTSATPGLAYFDESLWQSPREDSLLTESERELLNRVGFPVSSYAGRERALERQTRKLGQTRPGDLPALYTSAKQTLVTEWKVECRPLPKKSALPVEIPLKDFQAPLAGRALSATSLETFADCPAKYWVSRLKLAKDEDLLDRYALFFGQAVHASLENIFQSTDALTVENLATYFDSALQALDPLLTQKGSLAVLFTEAFRKLAPRIIECEKTIAALFPGSQRVGFEQGFEIEEGPLRLIGKIDRIDRLADGGTLVLDYKTGTIDFTPDHVAQGKNFQALLYWMAAEKLYGAEPAGIIFYDLKKGELRRGLMQEECVSVDVKKSMTRGHVLAAEKRNAILTKGREHLQRMADLITAGTFAPTPSAEACRFCEAATFCRQAVGYA